MSQAGGGEEGAGQVTEVVTGNHMVPAPNTAPGSAHGGRVLCLLHAALWASEAE